MIDILTNGFLTSPAAITFNGNHCSHGCTYCFANINNPKRTLDIKAVTSQLRNYKKRNDLVSFYLREKYPLLISNSIDPFSKSNQPFVNNLIRTLIDIEVPIILATRGGVGIDDILTDLKPSVWYISIPYNEDTVRQHYEPKATTLQERYDLIKTVTDLGHKVILSINPLNANFAPNPQEIAQRGKEAGATSVLINKLHLSPKQQTNLTDREKAVIGEDLLKDARGRNFKNDWIELAIDLYGWCFNNDMPLAGFDDGLETKVFNEFRTTYGKQLPTIYDWFNWCAANKTTGDAIYFQEFFDFYAPLLPELEGNVSKYIFNRAVIKDTSFYKTMTIKNLLHLYWEHPQVEIGLAKNFPTFSWIKKQTATKLDFMYDSDHNRVLHYNGENYNPKEYIILK